MKRRLLYIVLIISSICYGQIYSTTNLIIRYNGFQSTSYYNQPIRGYNNINYNNSKFGYRTSTGYSRYKGSFNLNLIHGGEIYYIPSYSSDPNYSGENSSFKGSLKKISSVDSQNTWLTLGMYSGVPSNASNEDMNTYYNAWKNNNNLLWED